MKVIRNHCINLKLKKSNHAKIAFSETDELVLLRLSAYNLNKKEISKHSNLNYRQIELCKCRIRRLMNEQNWERVLLTSFKKEILSASDYTISDVSRIALIHAAQIGKRMETRALQNNKITTIYDYKEELFCFIEEVKRNIKQNFKNKHKKSHKKKLSEYELAYLKLVISGYGQPGILHKLKTNIIKVENCKRSIFKFLDVKNLFNAIRMAFLLDLVEPQTILKNSISNEVYRATVEFNAMENKPFLFNQRKRNLNIYMLLIKLFNKIELDTLYNRCHLTQ